LKFETFGAILLSIEGNWHMVQAVRSGHRKERASQPASESRVEDYARLIEGAVNQVQDGKVPRLAPSAFKSLEEGYSLDELYRLVAPKRTLMRRKASDALLTPEETDKALRLARIAVQADRTFGNPEKSALWLRRENRALGGKRPIDLLATETGSRIVEELLGQIEHGMFV
jgi:putative toxin-antitoxin system antitoxin component (TIGR02293 family)